MIQIIQSRLKIITRPIRLDQLLDRSAKEKIF